MKTIAAGIRVVLGLALLCAVPVWAQERPRALEAVQAGFLLNFAKFVDWPEESFVDAKAPVVIGVLGNTVLERELELVVRNRTAHKRRLEIRPLRVTGGRLPDREQLAACHLLFVGASELPRLPSILEALEGATVMTVSDGDGFTKSGGVAEFVQVGGKLRFKYSIEASKRMRLEPTAALLRAAILVQGPDATARSSQKLGLG